MGLSTRKDMLVKCANDILRGNHQGDAKSASTVGQHWAKRFLKQHPEYHVRRQKPLDVQRKNAHHADDISRWMEQYQRIIMEKQIDPKDVYNFDEMGFRTGIGRSQWILTRDPKRPSYLASSSNRETLTCVEAISGDGGVLPPMIILEASSFEKTGYLSHWKEILYWLYRNQGIPTTS